MKLYKLLAKESNCCINEKPILHDMQNEDLASRPMVTVVMPAYKTPQGFFRESVQSILNQTYRDFEFLVVDDGLSAENKQYLDTISDKRLTVIVNEENIGQSRSSNKAIWQARGKYIARMDADDVALPERLQVQVEYMEAHPEAVACCSRLQLFGDRGAMEISKEKPFSSSQEALVRMLFSNSLNHPTMVMRASSVFENGVLYDERQLYAQDYMMWVTLAGVGEVGVIPKVLLRYRVHEGQISVSKVEQQSEYALRAQKSCFEKLGIAVDDEVRKRLFELGRGGWRTLIGGPNAISSLEDACEKLLGQVEGMADSELSSLIQRELSSRILSAGVKAIRHRRFSILGWGRFWHAIASLRFWGYYMRKAL